MAEEGDVAIVGRLREEEDHPEELQDGGGTENGSSEQVVHPIDDELPAWLGEGDPRRMKITTLEWQCSQAVKATIRNNPEIDELSDFWCSQFAIVCGVDMDDVEQRAQALQAFREEYNVMDTYQDGCRALERFQEKCPLLFLHFGFSVPDGTYLFVYDGSELDADAFNTQEGRQIFFKAYYYVSHACFPDFATIRNGCINSAECEGMDWTKKSMFKLIRELYSTFGSAYPHTGSVMFFHTGVFFNTMAAVFLKFLPPKVRAHHQIGAIGRGRLDALCLVPTPEVAIKRALQGMQDSLKLRYQNQDAFSLGPLPPELYEP